MSEWQPIETAPKERTPMIVVRGVLPSGYVTDPWCVWWQEGIWQRWPHEAPPTHWFKLPVMGVESPPSDNEAGELIQQLLADAKTFVAFAYANGVMGAEECGRRIESAMSTA